MTTKEYLNHQEYLLKLEYEYEKEEYQELCRNVGIRRRIRQGKCWYPLYVGRTFYNALDQLCVEVVAPDDLPEVEWEFEPGRPVSFFHTPTENDVKSMSNAGTVAVDREMPMFLPYSCMVSRIDGHRLHITIPARAPEVLRDYAMQGILGVQLAFDATSHRVMREAIQHLQTTDDRRILHLRDVLIGQSQPSFRTEQPVSFPWLNPSQQKAVQKVLCAREVAIVHGPPGTGKTTTLVEAIGETLKRETQVMVCAQSNAAVDWISEQLLARGISVLRVGNPMRVSDNLLAATYEKRYESHPDYLELWAIRKACRELRTKLQGRHSSASERHSASNQLNKLTGRATELEIRINEDLFAQSRVIACTLIGTASRILERHRFSTLFIDEAAQAFEAACWAAICKADRVVLAGDHCQLPPTIKCREAERAGLGHTLMEKVAEAKPACVQLLTTQYRMHQDIMQFSSDWFYKGALTAAPEIADRTIIPLDSPITWIDTHNLGYEEEQNLMSQSRLNTAEAALLIQTLREYVQMLGIDRMINERVDFGIISPYKSQVNLLKHLVKQARDLKPLHQAISVNTVDGFQGQERDVILISMVRGNDEGRIGFLNDLRRMNVAITRARMKLIIIGDTKTLSRTKFYNRLIAHISEKGRMITLPGEDDQPAMIDSEEPKE